jgi:collagenase-like PrtC family protease
MKLSIWDNLDNDLIYQINNYIKKIKTYEPKNIEFFGSFPNHRVSINRFNEKYININKEDFEKHLFLINNCNFTYNYVINSTKINNYESIITLINYLEWLNVKYVTISDLDLIKYIEKKYFWNIKVVVSIIADISNIKQFLNVIKISKKISRVILWQSLNHNLFYIKVISDISRKYNVDLELIANELCLKNCPFRIKHYEDMSLYDDNNINYFKICSDHRRNNNINIIDSPWIRPEDMTLYRKIWIKFLKLSWRAADTKRLYLNAKAYIDWYYKWNFFDIMEPEQQGIRKYKLDNKSLDWFLLKKLHQNI